MPSVYLLIGSDLSSSVFGARLRQRLEDDRKKSLGGVTCCVTSLPQPGAMQWIMRQEQEADEDDSGERQKHLLLIRDRDEITKMLESGHFKAWIQRTLAAAQCRECLVIVHSSAKFLHSSVQFHTEVTSAQLDLNFQLICIQDEDKMLDFILAYTRTLAKDKEKSERSVDGAFKCVRVNVTHQVGLQKLWETQQKTLKVVNGLKDKKGLLQECPVKVRQKALNGELNADNSRSLEAVLAKLLTCEDGQKNCIL